MPLLKARVSESTTLALLERVRQLRAKGENIASLAAGEPDFPTPDFVTDAALASIRAGNTKYVSSQGIPAFRKAIAADYRKRYGVSWVNESHVVVTAGSKQGIHVSLAALLSLGDEVLVPAPYWVSYPSLVKATGGVPKIFMTQEKHGFFPTIEELDQHATAKTKALIFSSPGNPSGTMISESHLKDILAWCRAKGVQLIYDEIYERLVLGAKKHVCPLNLVTDEAQDVLCVNALSKSLAMTGWRVGYIVSHPENIKALTALETQFITCIPGFLQDAGIAGLEQAEGFFGPVLEQFKKRCAIVLEGVAKIPGLKALKPEGAFYVLTDVSEVMRRKGIKTDPEFCEQLLLTEKMAVVPGTASGMAGWIRLSFAASEDEIRDALGRLARFCK